MLVWFVPVIALPSLQHTPALHPILTWLLILPRLLGRIRLAATSMRFGLGFLLGFRLRLSLSLLILLMLLLILLILLVPLPFSFDSLISLFLGIIIIRVIMMEMLMTRRGAYRANRSRGRVLLHELVVVPAFLRRFLWTYLGVMPFSMTKVTDQLPLLAGSCTCLRDGVWSNTIHIHNRIAYCNPRSVYIRTLLKQ